MIPAGAASCEHMPDQREHERYAYDGHERYAYIHGRYTYDKHERYACETAC